MQEKLIKLRILSSRLEVPVTNSGKSFDLIAFSMIDQSYHDIMIQ